MGKVLCFGELLLRFCPDTAGQWLTANSFSVYVGGAEANVATALAKWNIPVSYFTALPDNFLSDHLLNFLNKKGIETDKAIRHQGRLGTYYLPEGSEVKNAGVIYDRAGSSFASLKTDEINWDTVFDGVNWFHFSAICPALSQSVADVCEEALKIAAKKGITISVDLNYRAKLWQYGKRPHEIMPALVQYCDVVMGNVWAANMMLDIAVDADLHKKGNKNSYVSQAEKTSEEINTRFPKVKTIANTFRFGTDTEVEYYTTLFSNGKSFLSDQYNASNIVDKVGSGDCFMASLIYGHQQKLQQKEMLDFATAAAFSMLFIRSDSTDKTVDDIKNFIKDHVHTH